MFVIMDVRGRYLAETQLADGTAINFWSRWRHDAKRHVNVAAAFGVQWAEGMATRVVMI